MSTSSLPGFNPPIPKLHPPLEATTSPSRPTDPRAMLKNATSEESRFPISYASPSIPDRPSSDGGRPYTEVIRPPSGSSHPVAEIARPRQGDSASAVSASVSSAADISPRRPKARLYVKKAVAPTQSRMAVGERAAGQFQTQERQLVVNGSIPASRARSEATASAVSHVEAAESSGIAAIPATASEDTSRSASSAATLILRASSSTVPTASTPTPRPTSKLSTKALINRHKPQAATVVPSHSISQSLDVETIPNSAVLDVLAPALVVTKADPSRIDSGIEIWDYESRQTTHSLAGTAHHRRRDPALSASPRASTSNIREGDGRPDPSALGGPPVSIPTHPDPRARRGESLIPTPSPVQPGSSWLPSTDVVETPTSSLPTSAPQGGFSPFISRKPQSNYQDPPQDPTNFAAHSLPPRSSTPSSMTGSHRPPTATSQNSSHHSTQTTVVTPATSFSMPSRESLQKPPPPPLQKSWFRRVVLDPVKSKLGMESS
ncbi:hypothetical protein BC834DRAFT_636016 [Gloeopeniophorella convolvens]|nr:hypothetical protein BC834DRAFT_636016 [Gloeopeniophorella convolvens]